ncbi:MAG: hypothetical protein EOP48_18110 [Sphingobacteriales bacterium]|nr:MAG: hypothetical protein EOP48_18110 [Sphingobacteriales bacterium]
MSRLLNAFKRMGEARGWPGEFNLKNNLTEHIRFIYGPPGTGKTTKVAEEVISIMHSSDRKILILTPTNKAADVLTERIMEKLEHPYWLARYGASFSAKIANDGLLYDANTFQHQLFEKLVMITTIHRVPYEEFLINPSGERAKFADVHWDYVIFDECSMIPLSYFVLAMFECHSHLEGHLTQYWAGGDPMQIPPVIDLADEDMPENFNKEENIYTMIGLESFKKCEQEAIPIYGNKIENLTCQYRSVPQLGELFSRFTYHGQLEHGREKLAHLNPSSRPLPEPLIKLGIKPLTLLRYPVNDEDSVYKPAKLVKSPYHLYSAILTYEIISYLEKHVNSNDPWTIGIVCPYRSQATLINKMIESMEIGAHLTVITDTVHGFQGDECDMVFFIVNPPSERISEERYGALIHKKFLINVAISRARDYLIIVYPDLNTQGITNLSQFDKSTSGSIEHILEHDMGLDLDNITISSEHIEEKLFGEYGHIEKNIFTNQHQLVNIYARAPKKYVVREGHAAIDIHLKV